MRRFRVLFAAVLAIGSGPVASADWRVTVKGAAGDAETPVVIKAADALPPGDYRLTADGREPVDANAFRDQGATYLGLVLPKGTATPATYRLEPAGASSSVTITPDGPNLKVAAGGRPLTEYVPEAGPKPYYFPVIGPTGAPVTRAYPMKDVAGEDRDHPHQKSLWFTHGKVNGIDFWSEVKGHGSIKETSRPTVVSGAAVGLIRTTDDWLGPDGKTVCSDERVVVVYDTAGARVLDFDLTVRATAGPLTFGDTKEGMFGLRVASTMDVKAKNGGKIVNAEGLVDGPAWGKPSPWVDYTGPVEGKTVGIAILNHPDSFRSPTTWHVRDYGLFAANPFGYHDFGQKNAGDYAAPEGGSMRFRYRLILHEGDTPTARIPDAFRAYALPPEVELRGD